MANSSQQKSEQKSGPKKSGEQEEKKSGFAAKLEAFREKHPWFDRIMRMQEHYTRSRGNQGAGAVTYFGFLSFFPLVALAFAAVGFIARYYPDARAALDQNLQAILPGLIGEGPGKIDISTFAGAAGTVSLIGLAGFLYAGLNWLDTLREALRQMWAVAPSQANFILQKIKDVAILVGLGLAALVATAISAGASQFTGVILGWIGLGESVVAAVLLRVLGVLLAVALNTLLLAIVFARLPGHKLPIKNVMSGALLGGIGLEILRLLAAFLITGAATNPVYGPYAVIIAVLVWFNFMARVTMYAASWCVVGPVPTVEEKVSAEGETLDNDEAQAATDAREENDDDATVPLGEEHDTTAGNVGATTTGLDVDDSKRSRKAGQPSKSRSSDSGSGTKTGSSQSSRKPREIDLRDKGGSGKARAVAASGRDNAEHSKGSVLSFAGVMALVALRRRGKSQS